MTTTYTQLQRIAQAAAAAGTVDGPHHFSALAAQAYQAVLAAQAEREVRVQEEDLFGTGEYPCAVLSGGECDG
ncbi:MAG: hypothetical protein V3W44_09735 [Dehalococcoidales bacterium]